MLRSGTVAVPHVFHTRAPRPPSNGEIDFSYVLTTIGNATLEAGLSAFDAPEGGEWWGGGQFRVGEERVNCLAGVIGWVRV